MSGLWPSSEEMTMDYSVPLQHVAVISEVTDLSFNEVALVGAALQKQVMRDLTPVWNIQATVDAFATLDEVPIDYWPIIVRDDIDMPGAAGIHLDKDGQPFALVQYSSGWSLTASHECLEMLCDPTGSRVNAGKSPMPEQGRVNFLVEVCDPPEASEFAYTINGVTVSDFYTPHYFAPTAVSGVRYSYTGAITKPRQVLKGGYLSWHDPVTDHWFQHVFFGDKPQFRDLGVLSQAEGSIRTQIYEKTPEALKARIPSAAFVTAATRTLDDVAVASGAKAKTLRAQIDTLRGKK
jgi:hypothetical protein